MLRVVRDLVAELAHTSIGATYNQYAGSPLLRRRLGDYLEARAAASLLLVGEAAGYRGARVSGIPFTSERQLTGAGEVRLGVRVPPQRVLDVPLGPGAQPHPDRRVRPVERPDRVDQDVQGQVLGGGDVDLARPGGAREQLAELAGAVEEGEGVRQELLPLAGERRPPPRAALLVVERRAEPPFEGDQPVADPLLGQVQRPGRRPQAAVPGHLGERGHLVGGQGG